MSIIISRLSLLSRNKRRAAPSCSLPLGGRNRYLRFLGALVSMLALAHGTAIAAPAANAGGTLGYYRMPVAHGEHLWFVAEGDIWQANLQGGSAQRITTHPAGESGPSVSPDGRWLAFVGSYEGTQDAYIMPAAGGVPKRLTYDGANIRVWGFSANGEVLVTSPTLKGLPGTSLVLIDPKTGLRRALPVAQASDGAISPDGRTLYFTRSGLRGDNARAYRGGAMAQLWQLDLTSEQEARPLLPAKAAELGNMRRPMPYRDAQNQTRVAFLSDRDGRYNLWSARTDGQDLQQHTRHKEFDVRTASIDASTAVYSLGADLRRLDLNSNADAPIALSLTGDFDQQRQRWVRQSSDFYQGVKLSPNGNRVVLNVRGHLATQGVGQWRRAELPMPKDGRCFEAHFSHDGQDVYALCNFSTSIEIWRFAANGLKPAQAITEGASASRDHLYPSPDGQHIAHTDLQGRLYITDLGSKTATRQIDHSAITGEYDSVVWSSDSKHLAFTRVANTSQREQLMLHVLATHKTTTLTSDRYVNESPAFTPDGKWLYFLSKRQFTVGPQRSPWGDRNMGPNFDRRTRMYALALQGATRFPFAAPDELEKPTPKASAASASAASAPASAASSAVKVPTIALDGLAQRLYELPLPAGNYRNLRTDGKRLWWLESEGEKQTLRSASIDNQGTPPDTVSGDVREFELSADAKKMLLVRGTGKAPPEILLLDAGTKLPADIGRYVVRWSDWQVATDPKAEWRQMFSDAWRMHAERFYDADMHGVDWKAVRRKYEPLVDRITERSELSDLLAQMISEISALHSQVGAPDVRQGPEDIPLAGLGAIFSPSEKGLRVDRILRTDPELPSQASPLAAPGMSVHVGDIITAMNGKSTQGLADAGELLRGQAGQQVLLAIVAADGKARQVIATPVDMRRERQLRYLDWVQSRSEHVTEHSQGRYGYLHIAAMGREDIAAFAREFYANVERDGLIIDVRGNNGGNIESWILEKLMRRVWMHWQGRLPKGAPPYSNMQQTFQGKMVLLINEDTYSDGETFAEGFKRMGLGPVIGKRTSGAGVWLSDQNRLLDNGIARVAENGQFALDGGWLIEGIGVNPDIEVDNPPRATFKGQDAQLDAAIASLKERLTKQPLPKSTGGAYPRPLKNVP